ncbi:MAG: tetratricopeptide repeat protein, partial [Candidatus Alcyoniella australis]|nr:tetratricopeptide repeat protein [Candidatus Alcyoniella australis]
MNRAPLVSTLILGLVLLAAAPAFCQEQSSERVLISDFDLEIVKLRSAVANLETRLYPLQQNLDTEVEQRDLIVLRQRFVEGKEFFFKTGDYKQAAEVMFGICNHRLSNKLNSYDEALYILGEALYQIGRYNSSQLYLNRLVDDLGLQNPFAVPALLRLIEVDLALRDYVSADLHYTSLLSASTEEDDGGLGLYLIAKGHYQQNDLETSLEVLSRIRPEQKYWAEAQYFIGVAKLKKSGVDEATLHFESLMTAIQGDPAGKEKVLSEAGMALGRIYYKRGEFGRAVQFYGMVAENSDNYRRAQYETMWVYVTRNDSILAQLTSERSKQAEIQAMYDVVYASMLNLPPKTDLGQYEEQLGEFDVEIQAMDRVFDEIERSLVRLEGEALQSFSAVIASDPHSPLIPEAELLIGDVYAQVEDFQGAEDWYRSLQQKYRQLGAELRQGRTALSNDADRIELVEYGRGYDQIPPDAVQQLSVIPVDAAVWVSRDPRVRRLYDAAKMINVLRSDLEEARELTLDIREQIDVLQSGELFPILTVTRDRLSTIEEECRKGLTRAGVLRASIDRLRDPVERSRLLGEISLEESHLSDMLSQTAILQTSVEGKKEQILAEYR